MTTMKHKTATLLAIIVLAAACTTLPAQTKPDPNKGFVEYETFQGDVNSDTRLFKIDSTIGWDFNKHFGVFGGVPFYFSHASATTTGTTATSNSGIGNVYAGMVFRAPNTPLNYVGAITASAPTGSTTNGLSTGRGGVDFSNHISHSFSKFTPFLDAGVSNTVPDSQFSTRPFTSLGMITHWEEGADFEVVKHTYIGGSGYQILPFGNQKVFSKLVDKGQGGGGTGSGKNSFDNNAVSSGNDLTRENGFNAWVGFEPTPLWRAEIGFTRSMTFDLNSVAFNLRFNVGRMLRSRKIS